MSGPILAASTYIAIIPSISATHKKLDLPLVIMAVIGIELICSTLDCRLFMFTVCPVMTSKFTVTFQFQFQLSPLMTDIAFVTKSTVKLVGYIKKVSQLSIVSTNKAVFS